MSIAKQSVGMKMGAVATAALMCGLAAANPAPAADSPLKAVWVVFISGDDGKDLDSTVDLVIQHGQDVVADAMTVGSSTEYRAGSTTDKIFLDVKDAVTKDVVNDCALTLNFTPNGRDTWRFEIDVYLQFADGSQRVKKYPGRSLAENKRSLPIYLGQ